MTLFVFCGCAASADLGMRDTGRQQLYLTNRPPLVSASILSLLVHQPNASWCLSILSLKSTGQMSHSYCLLRDKIFRLGVLQYCGAKGERTEVGKVLRHGLQLEHRVRQLMWPHASKGNRGKWIFFYFYSLLELQYLNKYGRWCPVVLK